MEDLQEIEVMTFLQNMNIQQLINNPRKLQEFMDQKKILDSVATRINNQINEEQKSLEESSKYGTSRQYERNQTSSSHFQARLDQQDTSTPTRSQPHHSRQQPHQLQHLASPEIQDQPIDYSVKSKSMEKFEVNQRGSFINLKTHERKRKNQAPMKIVSNVEVVESSPSPTFFQPDSVQNSESESSDEGLMENRILPEVQFGSELADWRGQNIYANMPKNCIAQLDKNLRNSYNLKLEVLTKLNQECPVNYEYNPKKSRIRTNYNDPRIADDRTRNNIASRRSRQRKKFQTHIMQYSVDYDIEESYMLDKQISWLKGVVSKLEQKILTGNSNLTADQLLQLRNKCGLI